MVLWVVPTSAACSTCTAKAPTICDWPTANRLGTGAAAGSIKGKIVVVKKTDSSANAVTIVPPSGTIDGSGSKSLSSQYDALTITNNGINFFII